MVEIELKEEGPLVRLQRGPKSYTFGPFIKALELFYDAGSGGRHDLQDDSRDDAANGGMDGDDAGLEAFLNEEDYEDEDDEGGDDIDDMMYNSTTFGDEDLLDDSLPSSSATKEKLMTKELRALEALHSSLKAAVERCEQNSLARSVEERVYMAEGDEYCAILIKSEMQTISFYAKAVEMIHSKLSKCLSQENALMDSKVEINEMDQEHINDLVKAFLTIRYPEVSI